MLKTIRLVVEIMGVVTIMIAALWVRKDSGWGPKIALLTGLIGYGQSLLGRTRAPTKKEIKGEFLGSLETYRSQWAVEKRLQSGDLGRARNIAKNIQWSLGDFRAKLGKKFPATETSTFEDALHSFRSLEEQDVYIDLGESYRAFWKAGDDSFAKVDALLAKI